MRFERMRPDELRAAIAAHLPVVLPIGVMEYHGGHLPAGVDLLIVTRALDRLEAEAPERIVILPPFAYGAASHAVAGPEGTGTLHIDASALLPFAEGLFA
ncbi:MAG: creatininase family protein, partial [Gemmobacter sp.]